MSIASIQDVNSAIMFGDFNNDQLNSIIQAIKYRRGQLIKQQARALRSGDTVRFVSRGVTFFGTIEKVKIKNATVKVNNSGRYNVPMSMLEAV